MEREARNEGSRPTLCWALGKEIMDRLWRYLEARMPERGDRKHTVTCKFTVNTASMLIEAERKTDWTPTAERMPKGGELCGGFSAEVLICITNMNNGLSAVKIDKYDPHSGTWCDTDESDGTPICVTAWMPLPSAYAPNSDLGEIAAARIRATRKGDA